MSAGVIKEEWRSGRLWGERAGAVTERETEREGVFGLRADLVKDGGGLALLSAGGYAGILLPDRQANTAAHVNTDDAARIAEAYTQAGSLVLLSPLFPG